jgi:hypothetical protein
MGLDIHAYTNATKVTDLDELKAVRNHEDGQSEGAYLKGYRVPYKNSAFAARFEGLEEVPYEVEGDFHFRAGSYSGYGAWRKELAELVGVQDIEYFWARLEMMADLNEPDPVDMPFWQLLHFSDCEGVIGPEACKALAKDFVAWEERAKEYAKKKHEKEYGTMRDAPEFDDGYAHSSGQHFWAKYQEWKEAFKQGSTGWVAFG